MAEILVVESNGHHRLLLEEELEFEGHTVVSTASAEQALALTSAVLPDLVVVHCPVDDAGSIQCLRRLAASHRQLPIVIHTACEAVQEHPMFWCAEACIVKHSSFSELKQAIGRILGGSRPCA